MSTTAVAPARHEPAEPAVTAADDRRRLERLWLTFTMLALSVAVFGQSAGNTATDTKLDLVISPLRFLGRALQLWDPIGNAGQLQNQAYGYLFPIGPFYAGLHALGVAPWELQRAFESAVVCLAFLGTYRLARRLVVDSFWPALGAGLAYGLAPRVLSELTSISAELMPVAALPWVLLPLVDAERLGSPRRAAARSGVALLFAGGVNAAATLAILPVPALWLLTRRGGPARRALTAWWATAVALACAWWAIPLVLLGRYSPPFLDWVESSSVTTAPTSLLATLRGVDHWEGYLGPGVWPGGWILVTGAAAIVATTAVAALGLAGMSGRGVPHRVFLWATLLLGLVLVTLGHFASVGPPASGWMRDLLNGPLVPFRNVHKFDPVVRLPLALGVGHLLRRSTRLRAPAGVERWLPARVLVAALVTTVGAVAVAPLWTNHLVSSQRVTPDPSWWRSAASWLGGHSHGARALVVPGSASPAFVWGGTVDDPIQPLATTPWTVRGAVPLTQAGYVRLLGSIESMMAGGRGDPLLAPLLTRAGIGYVVLANDLDTIRSQSTPLVYVRATLDDSPGLHLRAGFGQAIGGSLSPAISLDGGGSVARPAVQIYSVDGGTQRAELQPLGDAVASTGSSDSLLQLIEQGLARDQAVLFGADGRSLSLPGITTDGLRRREASFAGSLTPSATLTEQQPYSQHRPAHDYLPADPGPLSAYRYEGIADVTASSSGADGLAFLNRSDRNGPWSALDGDPASSWQSTGFGAAGQWLQVRFERAVSAPSVTIRFGLVDDGPAGLPTRVRVTTDAGSLVEDVLPFTGDQELRLPSGPARWLRITVASTAGKSRSSSVAIAALTVPGVHPVRTLVVPTAADAQLYTFAAAPGYRSECLPLRVGPVCDPRYAAAGQEDSGIDRTFTAAPGDVLPSARVRLTGGTTLDAVLDAGNPVRALASTVGSPDPRLRPGAAVDGDPRTVWQAAAGDITPTLTLTLADPRPITGLTLTTPSTAAVALPLAATVTASGTGGSTRWRGRLPTDGHITFDRPLVAGTVTIRVDEATVRRSANSVAGTIRLLAPGIGEVRLDGAAAWAPPPTVTLGCGDGPSLLLDDTVVPLGVEAVRRDVLAGRSVTATACAQGFVTLAGGEHRVALAATADAAPVAVTLSRTGFALGAGDPAGTLRVERWGDTDRRVRVDTDRATLLTVHENANAGWVATLGGHRLRTVRVDGWAQGYVVPAGAHGTVELTFAPQRSFALGLGVGVAAIVALLALAYLPRRRRRVDGAGPPSEIEPGPLLTWLAFVGAVGLLAGWAGMVAVVALGVVAVLVGSSLRRWAPLVAGGVLGLAGLVVARGETTQLFTRQNSGQVQLLCVIALGIGVLAGLARRRSNREE